MTSAAPTSRPALLKCRADGIPEALRAHKRWALWAAVWDARRGKYDKVPRAVNDPGVGLSSKRPDLWSSFTEASQRLGQRSDMAGLGYCMTGVHGIVGIDLDRCVSPEGKIATWAQEVVDQLDSYTEMSPSGTGLRIFVQGNIDGDWTSPTQGIEVYGGHTARFLTVTGHWLPTTSPGVEPAKPEVLRALAARYAKAKPSAAAAAAAGVPDLLDESQIPDIQTLGLPDRALRFLTDGSAEGGDRSRALFATGVALCAVIPDDSVVFSLLAHNEHAMAVAVGHRKQNPDKVWDYLWREQCVKARAKAADRVASPDEFDVVETRQSEVPLPNFKRDNRGEIYATIGNVQLAVACPPFCGMDIRYDTFKDEIVIATLGSKDWRAFRDADYTRLRTHMERAGFKPISHQMVRDAVLLVAENKPFDSAIQWLEGVTWDGVARIGTFLPAYFGAEDTPYTRAVSLYLWTALAGRALVPGIKADMVPVLVGEQGEAKSSAIAAMVPDAALFTEISFHESDETKARKMRGCLVAEIAELQGLRTRELESIKAFITRQIEKWVPKYKEFTATYARRLVFIGTTNQDQFLADETGNRRWLPVRVARVDVAAVARDCDQLWAEAREMFGLLGVAWQDAQTLGKAEHAHYEIHDSWQDVISQWLDTPDMLSEGKPCEKHYLTTHGVLLGALNFEAKHITRREETRVGKVLGALGFVRKRARIEGKLAWIYVRGNVPSDVPVAREQEPDRLEQMQEIKGSEVETDVDT